jgi:hypothetical protein
MPTIRFARSVSLWTILNTSKETLARTCTTFSMKMRNSSHRLRTAWTKRCTKPHSGKVRSYESGSRLWTNIGRKSTMKTLTSTRNWLKKIRICSVRSRKRCRRIRRRSSSSLESRREKGRFYSCRRNGFRCLRKWRPESAGRARNVF